MPAGQVIVLLISISISGLYSVDLFIYLFIGTTVLIIIALKSLEVSKYKYSNSVLFQNGLPFLGFCIFQEISIFKKPTGILTGSVLDLQINLGRTDTNIEFSDLCT